MLLVIYIIIINLTSYSFCKNFLTLLFTLLLTFILSFSLRIQTVNAIRSACFAQLRLSIPSHRVFVTFILSLPHRVGTVGNAIRVCYTQRFALRASLAIVSYNIPYTCTHIVSYRITYYPAHTCCCHGTESYHSNNKCMSYIIPQPCTHTTTEKANPFFTSPNRAGGWAFSKSFPLRGYGFKICV